MSKRSRRPGREAIKEQRRARKKAQRALRQQQQAQGLSAPSCPRPPSDALGPCPQQLHRALLSTALASGEGLLIECGDAAELKALRLTPEALTAKVESLRITFAQWHTEMKPARQAAVLREAFGGKV